MFTRHFLFSTLAVIACAVPASATISYYADLPTFSAANTSAQQVSFDGLGLGGSFLTTTLSDGFSFTGAGFYTGGDLTVSTDPGGSWPSGDVLARLADSSQRADGSITITLPASVYALALDTSYALVNDNLQISVTAGADSFSQTPSPSPGPTTPTFLAFRTTTPITSVVISYPFNYPFPLGYALQLGGLQFDTVSGSDAGGTTGDPGSAPEPATVFLIGTGLAAVPFLRRRLTRS